MNEEVLKEYRKHPSRFIEDNFGIFLTKPQKIFIDNIKTTKNSYMVFPRYCGRKFHYNTLVHVKEILFGR